MKIHFNHADNFMLGKQDKADELFFMFHFFLIKSCIYFLPNSVPMSKFRQTELALYWIITLPRAFQCGGDGGTDPPIKG